MTPAYIKITDEYTEEGLKETIVNIGESFKVLSITSLSKVSDLLENLSFSSTTKYEIKNIANLKTTDAKYIDVMNHLVPTIIGLDTTLPKLVTTLSNSLDYIVGGKDIEDILTSIRKFITTDDHRMDLSRQLSEASVKNINLEKRVAKLGDHFSMDKNEDVTMFKNVFGNINTFNDTKKNILSLVLQVDKKLVTKLYKQYESLLDYTDVLKTLSDSTDDVVIQSNIDILLTEVEFAANYFTYASSTISLIRRSSEVYESTTVQINKIVK